MMKTQRQEQIYQLIKQEKKLSTKELSQEFNVSEMTVHRDLKRFIDDGLVKKVHGGVEVLEETIDIQKNQCVFCQKSLVPEGRLGYQLILSNHEIENTCCAHCGILRHIQMKDKVLQAFCHDFITNTTISTTSAWFVVDSSLQLGCCEPQVLVFGNRNHAKKFVKGFEGTILSFGEVSRRLEREMDASCCSKE
jgi:DNA-binding Lrp family transcriptional regulator